MVIRARSPTSPHSTASPNVSTTISTTTGPGQYLSGSLLPRGAAPPGVLRGGPPPAPGPRPLRKSPPCPTLCHATSRNHRRDPLQGPEALPHGSAVWPSGWTYENIKAATTSSEDAQGAVLHLVQTMVGGDLPYLSCLFDSLLLPIAKPAGGIRPIAIGEVWHRLSVLCPRSLP
jgi:hypothetical protein